jgi:hypothetical protein
VINIQQTLHVLRHGELLQSLLAIVLAHGLAALGVGQQAAEGIRQRGHVAWGRQQAIDAVAKEVGHSAYRGGDHR